MMLMIEELVNRWDKINILAQQRIDATHPLDFYIGVDISGLKELLLISNIEPHKLVSSKSIAIEIGKRKDKKWAICFKLLVNEEESVFEYLCWDLIESSREINDTTEGIHFVLNRFNKWQQLMACKNEALLDENVIKGLIGELLFLESYIDSGNDILTAVDGWLGPINGDRDFVYSNSWYEIKAVDPSATIIKISSIEQLDTDNYGELVIMFIEKTSSAEKGSFTLNEIVNRIKNKILFCTEALIMFEDKLFDLGYIMRKEYEEKHYIFKNQMKFEVSDSFPRIRRKMLPSSIIKLSYELEIASLHRWEISI